MIQRRTRALRWAGVGVVVAGLAAAVAAISSWADLPGVPTDVTKSAASEHVHILTEARNASPGNDWENTYVLLSATSTDSPVADIEKTLRSAGWNIHRDGGDGDGLLLFGDFPTKLPKYGVTVENYNDFNCLDTPEVCDEFEKAARDHDRELFVAVFMPYV